jgi:hypothetical protein
VAALVPRVGEKGAFFFVGWKREEARGNEESETLIGMARFESFCGTDFAVSAVPAWECHSRFRCFSEVLEPTSWKDRILKCDLAKRPYYSDSQI